MPSGPSRLDTSYEFDEYGRRLPPSMTNTVESQKTFVGGMSVQDEVADTGLMMMGHRFYAPDHGRFLNRDPIGFAGGMNLFEYAGGSPVSKVDPNGLRLRVGTAAENWTGTPIDDPGPLSQGEIAVAEAVIGALWEPADWAMTIQDIDENGFQWYHALAFAPVVSVGLFKTFTQIRKGVYAALKVSHSPQ